MRKIAIIVSVTLNVVLLAGVAFGAIQIGEFIQAFVGLGHERLQTQFEILSPGRGVVFLGDSLTEGGRWHELVGRSDAINRGIGGDRTADVLGRIETIIEIKPRQIFLMVGVNDIDRGVAREETLENYAKILDTFAERLPETVVVVESVLPVTAGWRSAGNDAIRALNLEIARMASERQLLYLDLHPFFADENGALRRELTNDGVHLLGPGYALWREHLTPKLVPLAD